MSVSASLKGHEEAGEPVASTRVEDQEWGPDESPSLEDGLKGNIASTGRLREQGREHPIDQPRQWRERSRALSHLILVSLTMVCYFTHVICLSEAYATRPL